MVGKARRQVPEVAGRVTPAVRKQGEVSAGTPPSFLLSVQSGTPVHELVSSTSGVGLPTLMNPSGKFLTDRTSPCSLR